MQLQLALLSHDLVGLHCFCLGACGCKQMKQSKQNNMYRQPDQNCMYLILSAEMCSVSE